MCQLRKANNLKKYHEINCVVMNIFKHLILLHVQNIVLQSKAFYDTYCCKVVKIIYDVENYFNVMLMLFFLYQEFTSRFQ